MKKITILFAAILTLTVFNGAFAQVKNNAIKTNLIGLVAGQYQLAYERAINEKMSVQLSAGYITYDGSQTLGSDSYKMDATGFIVIPEFRYYFAEGLKGAYAGAFVRYRSATEKYKDVSNPIGTDVSRDTKISSIGGGAVLGYQALISDALVIDIFVGPQYKTRSTTNTYKTAGVTDDDFNSKFIDVKIFDKSGVGVRFGINVGVAF
jgi:hypothetical protein